MTLSWHETMSAVSAYRPDLSFGERSKSAKEVYAKLKAKPPIWPLALVALAVLAVAVASALAVLAVPRPTVRLSTGLRLRDVQTLVQGLGA